tara:strand:- start:365 stop:925 length:561 start_codon:yes stop_codon:yes gene_type:complete
MTTKTQTQTEQPKFKRFIITDKPTIEAQVLGRNELNKNTIKVLNYVLPKLKELEETKIFLNDSKLSKKTNFCNFWDNGTQVYLSNSYGSLYLRIKICITLNYAKKDYDGTLYIENNIYLGREEGSSFSDTNTGFMSSKFQDVATIIEDMGIDKKYNYKNILKVKAKMDVLANQLREEKKKLRNITI